MGVVNTFQMPTTAPAPDADERNGPRVDAVHPQYTLYSHQWMKCRKCVEGEDSVKAAADLYLPRLGTQDEGQYEAYKKRAMFYGAAGRTVQGLTGAIMRKAAAIVFPGGNEAAPLMQSLSNVGASATQVAKNVLEEVITNGRVGVYVDAPQDGEGDPYTTLYFAENIVNWRTEMIGGRLQPTLVVLKEEAEDPEEADTYGFEHRLQAQYRVLRLVMDKKSGQRTYQVEVWRQTGEQDASDRDEWSCEEEFIPQMRGGQTLDFLPFVCIGPAGIGWDVPKSPILDLVNVNLSHYRTSADLEHGRHFTALPTAWVAGFDPKTTNLYIGSNHAWVSENPAAHAGFLEFSGAGLKSLSDALEEKEDIMAALGARLLEQQKATAEAAQTVALRQAGEHSVLANLAGSVSEGLSLALYWVAQWAGLSGTPQASEITLNQDFNTEGMPPMLVGQMMAAVQGGMMSWDTFFFNMERGEMYPENWTQQKESDKITAGPPMPSPTLKADAADSGGGAGGGGKSGGGRSSGRSGSGGEDLGGASDE